MQVSVIFKFIFVIFNTDISYFKYKQPSPPHPTLSRPIPSHHTYPAPHNTNPTHHALSNPKITLPKLKKLIKYLWKW